MAAANPSYNPHLTKQNSSNNAALNLPLDFEFIPRSFAAGAPKFMEWYNAFGLMLSIVWMYVSILRLLALLRLSR